ncbi:MAG: YihY/virulence factor BrkB family protein, partial [Cytophagaceae bacterium]
MIQLRVDFKKTWTYLKKTFIEFFQAEPMNYAALIAFYTIFSLPGILIILINIAGSVFGEELVRGELAKQIEEALGTQSAQQVQSVIENAMQSEGTTFATIIGAAVLAFSATTIFIAMQNAINHLWHIKPKPEKGLIKHIIDRILSFSMVVSLGFLLLASLVINI